MEVCDSKVPLTLFRGVPLVYCKNIICMLFGQNTVREEVNQKQYQNTLKNELDKRHGKV